MADLLPIGTRHSGPLPRPHPAAFHPYSASILRAAVLAARGQAAPAPAAVARPDLPARGRPPAPGKPPRAAPRPHAMRPAPGSRPGVSPARQPHVVPAAGTTRAPPPTPDSAPDAAAARMARMADMPADVLCLVLSSLCGELVRGRGAVATSGAAPPPAGLPAPTEAPAAGQPKATAALRTALATSGLLTPPATPGSDADHHCPTECARPQTPPAALRPALPMGNVAILLYHVVSPTGATQLRLAGADRAPAPGSPAPPLPTPRASAHAALPAILLAFNYLLRLYSPGAGPCACASHPASCLRHLDAGLVLLAALALAHKHLSDRPCSLRRWCATVPVPLRATAGGAPCAVAGMQLCRAPVRVLAMVEREVLRRLEYETGVRAPGGPGETEGVLDRTGEWDRWTAWMEAVLGQGAR